MISCGKTTEMISLPKAPIVNEVPIVEKAPIANEVPIVEKGHIARHPYIYTTLVATAVFLSSAYLRSELNADMLIDEYTWYSNVLYNHTNPIERTRNLAKNSKGFRNTMEQMVKAFRSMPNSRFLPANV
jgi:hypothetical protein